MSKNRFFKNGTDLFLFRENALMIVAAVVSLLLQIISFFTTLDGARAYFAETFAAAPLMFALAVQSVVYFLENGIRRRATFAKMIALALAVCCSSYFSFVGIYNNINPPESYLEKTYNAYKTELEDTLEGLEFTSGTSSRAAVNTVINGIESEYSALTSEKETLLSLSELINSVDTAASSGLTAPRRTDYYNYEDYAAAYSAYIESLSQSQGEEQRGKTEALLQKYGVSEAAELNSRISELTARLSLIESTAGASGSGFYPRMEAARAEITAKNRQTAERFFSLYGDITGEYMAVPEELFKEKTELVLPEYEEISGGNSPAVTRERLSAYVSSACEDVRAAGGEVDADAFYFENIYTLPITAVISGEFGADAVVSLLLAVLVDLLSLLFAMIFVKQKSILAASDTRSAVNMRDSLFEQNVYTAVKLGAISEGAGTELDIDALAGRLADFVGRFRAADFAVDEGFSLIARRSDLGNGFEVLIAFLCQFGLAKMLTPHDAELLSGGELCDESVLLKTKFLLWLSEKFGYENALDAKEVTA